jgi:hypothetical protein
VAASGGTVRPLSQIQNDAVTVFVSSFSFTPTGAPLLAHHVASSRPARAVQLLWPSSGELSTLIENATNPVWSPTGHVVFDRNDSVWAVPTRLRHFRTHRRTVPGRGWISNRRGQSGRNAPRGNLSADGKPPQAHDPGPRGKSPWVCWSSLVRTAGWPTSARC